MTCDRFRESYELYALGLLEDPERVEMTEHLREGCSTCRAELERALEQNAMVSKNVPLVGPPRHLRQRIANSFAAMPKADPGASPWQWLYWAVAAVTILALTVGLSIQNGARRAEQNRLRDTTHQLDRMAHAVEIMQAPGTEQVQFGSAQSNRPRGNLFVHRHLGIVLVADRLSNAPSGWKYESWIVPKNGPPRPVETFAPDSAGQAVSLVPGPVKSEEWQSIAVSMEPDNTHPQRPTKFLFSAPLNAQRG